MITGDSGATEPTKNDPADARASDALLEGFKGWPPL